VEIAMVLLKETVLSLEEGSVCWTEEVVGRQGWQGWQG